MVQKSRIEQSWVLVILKWYIWFLKEYSSNITVLYNTDFNTLICIFNTCRLRYVANDIDSKHAYSF